jgi:hypothetical protein
VMHADCEAVLLEDGSQQDDIWGADWDPAAQLVTFEAPRWVSWQQEPERPWSRSSGDCWVTCEGLDSDPPALP